MKHLSNKRRKEIIMDDSIRPPYERSTIIKKCKTISNYIKKKSAKFRT